MSWGRASSNLSVVLAQNALRLGAVGAPSSPITSATAAGTDAPSPTVTGTKDVVTFNPFLSSPKAGGMMTNVVTVMMAKAKLQAEAAAAAEAEDAKRLEEICIGISGGDNVDVTAPGFTPAEGVAESASVADCTAWTEVPTTEHLVHTHTATDVDASEWTEQPVAVTAADVAASSWAEQTTDVAPSSWTEQSADAAASSWTEQATDAISTDATADESNAWAAQSAYYKTVPESDAHIVSEEGASI
jgi:hypothetical protein